MEGAFRSFKAALVPWPGPRPAQARTTARGNGYHGRTMVASPNQAVPWDPADVLDKAAAFIDARLPRWHAPGVVVGLTDRERTLGTLARGWGDLPARRALTTADRFQIGSISKSFAAIVLLQEVEKGNVDLHRPVVDYVPWFSVRSRFAPITLHHLLTHTSGLVTGSDASPDARHELWLLRDFECTYAPGERFLYSNAGYKLLGVALEHVTGRPFTELLVERVFRPLGMADSDPMITLAMRASTAAPHCRLFEDRPPHAEQPFVVAPWYESASADGSIVSTAADMCAYARSLLGRGAAPGGRLLRDASFDLLTGRHVDDPTEADTWYGYGLGVYHRAGRTLIGHSGGMVGFSSYLMIDPEAGLGVVVLMNGNEDRRELVDHVLAAGRAAAGGHVVPAPPPPADPRELGAAAEEYAGVYEAPRVLTPPRGEGGTGASADGAVRARRLRLVADGGHLVWRHEGGDVVLERTRDDDVFLVPHPELDRFTLRFWRDDRGRIAYATHGPDWYAGSAYGGPARFPSVPRAAELCGHYHTWSAWTSHLRVVERRGALWLIAPWLEEPGGEAELVPLADGSCRVGREEWHPERLTIDTVLDGRATRATLDFLSFYRAETP